jgi:uncharacterized membrane protein YdjX (TVP38/TMEM64 family)
MSAVFRAQLAAVAIMAVAYSVGLVGLAFGYEQIIWLAIGGLILGDTAVIFLYRQHLKKQRNQRGQSGCDVTKHRSQIF